MHSGDMRHVRILANLFKRASRSRLLLGRDGVRLPLQTVGAVLLAYAWMTWQRMPAVAWGAFSALFVVRATIEGTVTEAIARIEQLWLTVPLLERIGRLTLTDNVCQRLGTLLDEVARAARRQIDALARAIREKNARGLACPAAQPLARLAQAIEHGAFSPAERETVALIARAWREVTHELDAVCQGLEARRHDAPSSPIQHRG